MFTLPKPEIIASPVQPDAAIAFWQARAAMTRAQAKGLEQGARWRAFYVTGLAEHDMIEAVKDALGEALSNGETLADFKKRIGPVIEAAGWKGHRVDNIFRTNMQTAYAAGRYAKMQAVKATRPYWQYITVEDKRRRPSHAVLHGLVFPADHEFWGTNYPPNGFRCRCTVRTLSDRQMKREGLTAETDMPGDTMWTDPVTGMEYHVGIPGADKGFAGNVGKDWMAGLDLKKYPDLHKGSYEEQRGVAGNRPAPVKNYNELCEAIKERCGQFATNNGITSVVVNKDNYFMATYCDGRFMLSEKTFTLRGGQQFNAAQEIKEAWNKLAGGKPLTWNEEYSLESLWHEITHNRQRAGRMPRGSSKECMMEVTTQWTARRTYQQLVEELGGRVAHQDDIIKNGLGYGGYLKRFDRLLGVIKVKDADLLPHMLEAIKTLKTPDYLSHMESVLTELSGAKKSAIKRALSNLGKPVDFEDILKECGLVS